MADARVVAILKCCESLSRERKREGGTREQESHRTNFARLSGPYKKGNYRKLLVRSAAGLFPVAAGLFPHGQPRASGLLDSHEQQSRIYGGEHHAIFSLYNYIGKI